MNKSQTTKKEPWDYILPAHVKMFGPDIRDPDKRSLWCQAFFYGGNTLYLWNKAIELKIALLSACALKKGQQGLLISKYSVESGLTEVLRSVLGEEGHLSVKEILPEALASFSKIHSTTGKGLQWDFSYFNSLRDESLDLVILFGVASHIGNLKDCVQHIHRVLREGGRVVIAETPWGGKDFLAAAHMDAHLEGFITRILSGIGLKEEELPYIGPDDLRAAFEPFLSWNRVFYWQGLYLFYGQKGENKENFSLNFPLPTEDIQIFLTEKASTNPWDFLTSTEIAILGSEVVESNLQKNWGRAIFFASNLVWCWENARILRHLMYSNLRARPGDRVLVIGEVLEGLGFLQELRKRVGETGEIIAFDMVDKSRSGYIQQWEMGPGAVIPEKHHWDYSFADKHPDHYFDLIWLPQGVHHAHRWIEIAPKLIRVLKTGGQVMMAECRVPAPEFHRALQISSLLRCIVDKIFWAMDTTLEEMPDYSAADLALAFGDSLENTFGLEWKGWLLFWGTKCSSS